MKKGWALQLMYRYQEDDFYSGVTFIEYLYDKGYEIIHVKREKLDCLQLQGDQDSGKA